MPATAAEYGGAVSHGGVGDPGAPAGGRTALGHEIRSTLRPDGNE
jgi:hypothetical protein